MIVDAVTAMQAAVRDYLTSTSASLVELDGVISSAVLWRPHVFQSKERVGWQLFSVIPDSYSWEKRIDRACATDAKLTIGVATTEEAFTDAEFLLACQRIGARVILLKERKDTFVFEKSFASIPDFICERNIKLDAEVARSVLDVAHARALKAKTKAEKGVSLEVVVALVLSQVDNFEVDDIGISNRTQQMDVLVHNRSVGGVLGASPIVLAEAKNWRKKVTPTEHAVFLRKLASRNRRAKIGFLVTTGKFTTGVALEARRDSMEDIIVVCVDGVALPKIWRGNGTITREVERLVINASIGS